MTDVESQLVDLAQVIDHPDGNELVDTVRATIAIPALPPLRWHVPARRARWVRAARVVAVAATIAVVAAVAIPDSRSALANLFNIGGVDVRDAQTVDREAPKNAPSATSSHPPSTSSVVRPTDVETVESVAAANLAVDFSVRLPRDQTPSTVTVDRRVPGGSVTADYGAYRIVQLEAPESGAVMTKILDPGTRVQSLVVRGVQGAWFTGTHHRIAYLDRNGDIRYDTTREVGHVLLWSEGGVTFRVEGPNTLAVAQRIADSIG